MLYHAAQEGMTRILPFHVLLTTRLHQQGCLLFKGSAQPLPYQSCFLCMQRCAVANHVLRRIAEAR